MVTRPNSTISEIVLEQWQNAPVGPGCALAFDGDSNLRLFHSYTADPDATLKSVTQSCLSPHIAIRVIY